jgi:TonB family protein
MCTGLLALINACWNGNNVQDVNRSPRRQSNKAAPGQALAQCGSSAASSLPPQVTNISQQAMDTLRTDHSGRMSPSYGILTRIDRNGGRLVGSYRICIDEAGRLARTEVVSSSGDEEFDINVLEQIECWTFSPFRDPNTSEPIPVCTIEIVNYPN